MKKYRKILFYVFVNGIVLLLLLWIAEQGKMLELSQSVPNLTTAKLIVHETAFQSVLNNFHHPLSILIVQIIIILISSRLLGSLFRKIGQPMVIGEIVAGIVLGPSLLGLFFPSSFNFLFPVESLPNIQFISQVGLILFMFVIGMDLDLSALSKKASNAIIISHASIVFPFALGMGLAYFLYSKFAGHGIPYLSFGLFIGIAMSITAFPVLARIIQERGWTKTSLGAMAITCAAADDITAWCLLALVIAITKAGSLLGALFTMTLALLYIGFMIFAVKPFLSKISNFFPNQETMGKRVVGIFFIILFISSYITEIVGIHALFGAFMAGVAMPANLNFRKLLIEKIEDVSMVVLLPLFFVYTGLRTQIGLLNDYHLWLTCLAIIGVAVVGKFLGSSLAARFVGLKWKESLSLGVLMNTRGLMELVVLNIGYDLGVLSPEIFSMMVLMALVTTFMTGPGLNFINWLFRSKDIEPVRKTTIGGPLRILLSFGPASAGVKLLNLATLLNGRNYSEHMITALHFTKGTDTHPLKSDEFAINSFKPLLARAREKGIPINTLYKVSDHIDREIIQIINEQKFDFLLIGAGQSFYNGSLFSSLFDKLKSVSRFKFSLSRNNNEHLVSKTFIHQRAQKIMETAPCNVGVFIDNGFEQINQIYVYIVEPDDHLLLDLTKRILTMGNIFASVFIKKSMIDIDPKIISDMEYLFSNHPNTIQLHDDEFIMSKLETYSDQLIIASNKGLQTLLSKKKWPSIKISALIIHSFISADIIK